MKRIRADRLLPIRPSRTNPADSGRTTTEELLSLSAPGLSTGAVLFTISCSAGCTLTANTASDVAEFLTDHRVASEVALRIETCLLYGRVSIAGWLAWDHGFYFSWCDHSVIHKAGVL